MGVCLSDETFIVGGDGNASMRSLCRWLWTLDLTKRWKVTVGRLEPKAGVDQEAVLRGKEAKIAAHVGYEGRSELEDLHDEFLKMHYGVEKVQLGNRTIERPLRRTRTGKNPLKRHEMTEHLRFVERFAAQELGVEV